VTKARYIGLRLTQVTGDVTGWAALTKVTAIVLADTKVTGDVSGWAAMTYVRS